MISLPLLACSQQDLVQEPLKPVTPTAIPTKKRQYSIIVHLLPRKPNYAKTCSRTFPAKAVSIKKVQGVVSRR